MEITNQKVAKTALVIGAGILCATGVIALTFLATSILDKLHLLSPTKALVNAQIKDVSAYTVIGLLGIGLIGAGSALLIYRKEVLQARSPLFVVDNT